MLRCGNSDTGGIRTAVQLIEACEGMGAKFAGGLSCALVICIEYPDQLDLGELAINACVIAAELPGSNDGDTNLPGLHGPRHSLFIPADALLGSTTALAATA